MKNYRKKYGESIAIGEAYEELSPTAFAAYIKLSCNNKRIYKRPEINKILGVSRAQATRLIKELRLVGYIKVVNMGRGVPSLIKIYRRISIDRNHMFVFF